MEVLYGDKWWQDWVIYSFRRAFIGYIMFGLGATMAMFPLLNLVTLPLFAWVAAADYYDYVYTVSPWMDQYLGELFIYVRTQEFRDIIISIDSWFKSNGIDTGLYDMIFGIVEALPDPKILFTF